MRLLRYGSKENEPPLFAPEIFTRTFWAGKSVSDFQAGTQQDSQEFLNKLLQAMMNEEGQVIKHVFDGVMKESLICLNCSVARSQKEHFGVLILEIHELEKKSVQGAFDKHFAEETMLAEEPVECPTCSSQTEGTAKVRTGHKKKFEVDTAPPLLTIFLSRWKAKTDLSGSRFTQSKNASKIAIDLSIFVPSLGSLVKYNLYSVVVHSGSVFTGHYITYVQLNGTWLKANDQQNKIISVQERTVLKSQPYLLFYEKNSIGQHKVREENQLRRLENMTCRKCFMNGPLWALAGSDILMRHLDFDHAAEEKEANSVKEGTKNLVHYYY